MVWSSAHSCSRQALVSDYKPVIEQMMSVALILTRSGYSRMGCRMAIIHWLLEGVLSPKCDGNHEWLIAMGKIVELSPLKLRSASAIHKLSPGLISTAAQVNRIGLTILGTTAFCFLSLLSPDSALLGGSEKINVPLAGPASFFGFMLLGRRS